MAVCGDVLLLCVGVDGGVAWRRLLAALHAEAIAELLVGATRLESATSTVSRDVAAWPTCDRHLRGGGWMGCVAADVGGATSAGRSATRSSDADRSGGLTGATAATRGMDCTRNDLGVDEGWTMEVCLLSSFLASSGRLLACLRVSVSLCRWVDLRRRAEVQSSRRPSPLAPPRSRWCRRRVVASLLRGRPSPPLRPVAAPKEVSMGRARR